MPTNRAAWQDKAGVPLVIRPTPYPDPTSLSSTQILLKTHAWAFNPVDLMIQESDSLPFVSYPLITGEDVAGSIIAVGSDAAVRFKPRDRILAMTSGVQKSEMGAFQEFVIVDAKMACHIPSSLSFAEGSVFPLCIRSASYGLFGADFLGLPLPKLLHERKNTLSPNNGTQEKGERKILLVWGGASAVGSNVIQLALAAGLTVISTSSPHNFDYLRSLGASQVFDYSSSTIVPDLITFLSQSPTPCAGIFQAAGSIEPSLQIARQLDLFVGSATFVPEGGNDRAKFISGPELAEERNERGVREVFERFLPKALEAGDFKVAPGVEVVERKGLEGIQDGIERLRKGVSARKIVVVAE